MTKKRTDLRFQRTGIFIQNALIELARTRDFDAITVEDIARAALVNRTTFYKHYKDKYQLVEELFKEAAHRLVIELGPLRELRGLTKLTEVPKKKEEEERFQAAWVGLFEHFAFNSHLYTALLRSKGGAWFQTRMREHLVKLFKDRGQPHFKRLRTKPQAHTMPVDVVVVLLVNALIGLIIWWLENGKKYSTAEVVGWFRRIGRRGYVDQIV